MNRVTNTLLALSVATIPAFRAAAQGALMSNGDPLNPANPGLSTGPWTESGILAPGGAIFATWSEVQAGSLLEANAAAGFSDHNVLLAGAYRFADDFTIPGPHAWRITGISFYAYQVGASPTGSSPFSGVNLRILDDSPLQARTRAVYGDTTTNRLSSTGFAQMYRVFHSVATGPARGVDPDTQRPVWHVTAQVPAMLIAPGHYWLDWQITCTDPNGEAFVPSVTLPGLRTRPGANALQFCPPVPPQVAGAWLAVLDPGKPASAADLPQDLPFIIYGYPISTSCPADIATAGNPDPNAGPDGFVTGEDFDLFVLAYVTEFRNAEGRLIADVADSTGQPIPDGFVTGTDFDAYVQMYFAGCS